MLAAEPVPADHWDRGLEASETLIRLARAQKQQQKHRREQQPATIPPEDVRWYEAQEMLAEDYRRRARIQEWTPGAATAMTAAAAVLQSLPLLSATVPLVGTTHWQHDKYDTSPATSSRSNEACQMMFSPQNCSLACVFLQPFLLLAL